MRGLIGILTVTASWAAGAAMAADPPPAIPPAVTPASDPAVRAAEGDEGSSNAETAAPEEQTRIPKGKRSRDKEIEGSEARDRFQADTVLKSKYKLNGEQLEVDPD